MEKALIKGLNVTAVLEKTKKILFFTPNEKNSITQRKKVIEQTCRVNVHQCADDNTPRKAKKMAVVPSPPTGKGLLRAIYIYIRVA